MEMHRFWMMVDPYIIWFYRLTGYAFVDFFLGTFVLAWIVLLVGELTASVVFFTGRRRVDAATQEARRYQDLSMEALSAGDKEAYRAANKMANDAFGRSFFMQIALSAAFLWPAFLALDWMSQRFAEVEFPLLFSDRSVGFIGVFIVMYVAAYLMLKRIKYQLPCFGRVKNVMNSYDRPGDLGQPPGGGSPRSTGDTLRQAQS
jgi:hypothetical protein